MVSRRFLRSCFPGLVLGLTSTLTLVFMAAGDAPPVLEKEKTARAGVGARESVPFEMLASNHMVVQARINGEEPFRLIFDLGAPITLLSNSAGEASGVIKKAAPRSILFAMRGEARVKSLQVGGLTATDLPVIVLDHPALRALGGVLGRPLDGIIGFTFFARYRTTIDYQAREMTFEPVDFKMRDLLKDLPARLAGPKVVRRRVLAPGALFGLTVAEPADGLAGAGVRVVSVSTDSPAARAGLKSGDVLTALDGRWTASVADTYAAAAGTGAGRPVPVVVLRDGKELALDVTPREGF
ncbi:MAG: hypothetical protein NVSMB9_22580 [Isosphaeraceae bacterium]